MSDIIDYIQRIAAHDERLSQQVDAYEVLGERLAEVERRVKQYALVVSCESGAGKEVRHGRFHETGNRGTRRVLHEEAA